MASDVADCRGRGTAYFWCITIDVLRHVRHNNMKQEFRCDAAQSDSEHYREMAKKLRELVREFHVPGVRKEILSLAARYERRADNLDAAGF
jgi:hypothetical protein